MQKYIINRLILSVFILFFVMLFIYGLMRALPASFIENTARELSQRPGSPGYTVLLERLKATYGFDKPWFIGFFSWLSKAARGDFGNSWLWGNMPVTEKFAQVIWYSFALGAVTLVLEFVIAVPLGIISARKQYSKTDYAVTVFALIGISLPSFFIATLLKLVFAYKLGWVDPYGVVSRMHPGMSDFGKIMDIVSHFILPTITLLSVSIGYLMRFTRTNMLEVLNSDYIRTARAKGVSEKRVVYYHAYRNTLIQVVTILGGSLPTLFAGALITEQLFAITGIGYTAYQSIVAGDIPFTMFYMTFMAVLTLMGTLIADILYAVVDPRVRVN